MFYGNLLYGNVIWMGMQVLTRHNSRSVIWGPLHEDVTFFKLALGANTGFLHTLMLLNVEAKALIQMTIVSVGSFHVLVRQTNFASLSIRQIWLSSGMPPSPAIRPFLI